MQLVTAEAWSPQMMTGSAAEGRAASQGAPERRLGIPERPPPPAPVNQTCLEITVLSDSLRSVYPVCGIKETAFTRDKGEKEECVRNRRT